MICAEVHMNPEPEDEASPDVEKPNNDNEPEGAEVEEDQLVVEFKDQAYELSQAYELEEEYQDMMTEQEAAAVQALTPWEQAEYQELSRLHQQQAEVKKEIMGLSHTMKERMTAKTLGLPVDLVEEVSRQRFQQSKNYTG